MKGEIEIRICCLIFDAESLYEIRRILTAVARILRYMCLVLSKHWPMRGGVLLCFVFLDRLW